MCGLPWQGCNADQASFFNGGLLFSTVVLLGIAAISLWAFLLLTQSYLVVPGSFGGMSMLGTNARRSAGMRTGIGSGDVDQRNMLIS